MSSVLHEKLTLYHFRDRILIVPQSDGPSADSASSKAVSIDRKTVDVKVESTLPSLTGVRRLVIHGILGLFDTTAPSVGGNQIFLLVISRKVRVGEVLGHTVWRVEAVDIIDLRKDGIDDPGATAISSLLRQQLINVFSTPYFFFSYSTDLTRSRQTLQKLGYSNEKAVTEPEELYWWNKNLLSPLRQKAQDNGIIRASLVPIIHGALFINKCSINGHGFTWCLISRRSVRRVGARLNIRGCDDDGYPANFVETEQIVQSEKGAVASFVQLRGSMPLCWQQYPDLRYKPPPKMIHSANSLEAYIAHFKRLLSQFSEIVIINLVDQKGAEGDLEINFKNVIKEANLRGIKYVAFDFHKECKKMRYDRLSILIGQVIDDLYAFEYFFDDGNPASLKSQKGVFRANCVDSLDRTNVVQSLLATENLKNVLTHMGILHPGDDILAQNLFQDIYRNTWADHADIISVQYAGTGALKTDFTRTGKRSTQGLIQDGWNAMNRYFLNNFKDGDKTDAMRLVVGEVSIEQFLRGYNALTAKKMEQNTLSYLPNLWALVCLILISTLIFAEECSLQLIVFVALCIFLLFTLTKMIMQNGKEFVNVPCTIKRVV